MAVLTEGGTIIFVIIEVPAVASGFVRQCLWGVVGFRF